MTKLALRSTRVVTPQGVVPASILVRDGRIEALEAYDPAPAGEAIEAGDHVVLPGLVDVHTHCDEPGRTEWEGYYYATRAAAAGGYTTIVDMPLNNLPETSTVEYLNLKAEAAKN